MNVPSHVPGHVPSNVTVPPARIELGQSRKLRKLYESFYFRGNLEHSPISFWLKHNLLEFCDDPRVRVDNILVLFNEETSQSEVVQQSKWMTFDEYQRTFLQAEHSWHQVRVDFENGGFFEIALDKKSGQLGGQLKGMIPSLKGPVTWELVATFSELTYYHFNRNWFYRGFFPKKKILTADCLVRYAGKIASPFCPAEGHFRGINGHNWGKEHAARYAYANCNEFTEAGKALEDSYFDGLSAKVNLIGPFQSPFLSVGSLFHQGVWTHFNRVFGCWRPRVADLTKKTYHVIFANPEYELDVCIDGESSAWTTLDYDHPSHKLSQVHNTKRANGVIKLTRLKDRQVIADLRSSSFELETLI